MEEIKAVLSYIPFWFFEKFKLRKFEGISRPGHMGDRKRNDVFYSKLEKSILPVLEASNFTRLQKRIFIRENSDSVSYIFFALNKQLNGLCVDYGEIVNDRINKSEQSLPELIKLDSRSQRLRPDVWAYDYQYPVKKSDRNDEAIISEIENLIKEKI